MNRQHLVAAWACWLGVTALVVSGCVGKVGEADSTRSMEGGSGTGGTGPAGSGDPGRVAPHRLNNREYDNTVRDLLGIDLKLSTSMSFPEDEWGDGFNNQVDVLSISSLGVEKYLDAAQSGIKQALASTNAASRARIMVCTPTATDPTSCVNQILSTFARRAFRRSVTMDELAPYMGLVTLAQQKGDTVEIGLETALAAMLVAPDFLFRMEIDPTPGVIRKLDGFELASRLSYFIWSSMPDDALLTAAETGQLSTPEQVATQVRRLFADPKASSFRDIMTEQWMHIAGLPFALPDTALFPKWQEPLRAAMEQETRAFMAPILTGAVSAQEMLTANYTYANRLLGEFYGLPGAAQLPADVFQRVALTDDSRGGMLRQGSMLLINARPGRTSPTKRGKWILERLLCEKPPPPPADVPTLDPDMTFTGTLRQRLQQQHEKAGAGCAGCHTVIDPMGFGLEHYDAIGLWRDQDNGLPIDATGQIPGTGVAFDGASTLAAAVAADARFPNCVAKQVLSYALGRFTTPEDLPFIDNLGQAFAATDFKIPSLVEAVSTSMPMNYRRAE